MSYEEALRWLYGLQRFGIKLGLENARRLIATLRIQLHSRVIHVAGTNGKGSVCAMLDAICRAQGYCTGLFTSPHLVNFRERIRVNGEMISEGEVADGLRIIQRTVGDWQPHPTFFEVVTALALRHFADRGTEITILETGMGGRLDATNAIDAAVSVITPIALDHQKWLGQSLAQIASEKAGIIKARTPVVSAPQSREAELVIRARAVECEAPLRIVHESYDDTPIALRGVHQKENAAVAMAALSAADIKIESAAIARGLLSVEWPARFQQWDDRTIIDGAHNPAAAHVLAQTWREHFGESKATLILAILSDKDMRGICRALAAISDYVLLPKISSERAAPPEELRRAAEKAGLTAEICRDFDEAVGKGKARAASLLITGSLHFAGEALAYLENRQPQFERCAQ